MSNPTSTGIGQGAAQVFNLNGLVNTYKQFAARNAEIARQDMAAAQEMMQSYDPNKVGIRSKDIPKYNETYNKLKDIYISNKRLYTNPASNIEAYKEAEKLKNEMRQMAADSKTVEKTYGEAVDAYTKNPYDFEDGSMKTLLDMNNMSTDEIKKVYGGRVPGVQDFHYKERPIDYGKVRAMMYTDLDHQAGPDNKPAFDTETKVQKAEEGYNNVTLVKHYRPEGVLRAYQNASAAFPELNKNYNRQLQNMKPEQLDQMQAALDAKLGERSFKINTPEALGVADFTLNYSSVAGETQRVQDMAYKREQELAKDTRNFKQSIRLKAIDLENSIKLKKTKGVNDQQTNDDQLMSDATGIVSRMKGVSTPSTADLQALEKLGFLGEVGFMEKESLSNSQFRDKIEQYNKQQRNGSYRIDVSNDQKLGNVRNSGVIVVTGSDDKGKDVTYMVDLSDPRANVKLYNLYKIMGEKTKQGVMQNVGK